MGFFLLAGLVASAQEINEDQPGAWYMYFFVKKWKNSHFGIQGDYQFRYWNVGTDLEQLLLRTGITYTPKNTNVLFTWGYAHITSGTFGKSRLTSGENRIYQEALLPQKVGSRFLLTHRFRYEQRWVHGQDFRTRYRYNLFVNVLFNGNKFEKGVSYLALYNEVFLNGERTIAPERTVEIFDRNRTYIGLGYGLGDKLRLQAGWMLQQTDSWGKGQAQLSLHHNW